MGVNVECFISALCSAKWSVSLLRNRQSNRSLWPNGSLRPFDIDSLLVRLYASVDTTEPRHRHETVRTHHTTCDTALVMVPTATTRRHFVNYDAVLAGISVLKPTIVHYT